MSAGSQWQIAREKTAHCVGAGVHVLRKPSKEPTNPRLGNQRKGRGLHVHHKLETLFSLIRECPQPQTRGLSSPNIKWELNLAHEQCVAGEAHAQPAVCATCSINATCAAAFLTLLLSIRYLSII